MANTKISLSPVSGALGAVVSNIDLAASISDETEKALYAAWLDYQVLFFENQELTPDEFKTAVKHFGEIEIHPFIGKIAGDDEVELLNDKTNPVWTPPTSRFHIDVSMMKVPTKGAALYAVDVPLAGGDTIWVNAYAAWEGLSSALQRFVEDKHGLFIAAHRNALDGMIRGGPETHEIARGFLQEPTEHPLVHVHPETGRKALFVDTLFMWSIVELAPDESDAIRDFLFNHVAKPEFQCRYHWRPGSVAIWDNRCTLHRRVADTDQSRLMHRLPIRGEQAPSKGSA
jgi:taurine dioxygenase